MVKLQSRYNSCHTCVNSLNRLLSESSYLVETETRHEDGETEWRAVILYENGEVLSKTAFEDSLSRAIRSVVETLGVVV